MVLVFGKLTGVCESAKSKMLLHAVVWLTSLRDPVAPQCSLEYAGDVAGWRQLLFVVFAFVFVQK